MRLVEFVPPVKHPLWRLCLQMGITDVIVKVNPTLTGLEDPWRYETLGKIVDGLKSEGLTVVGLEGDPFDMSPIKAFGSAGSTGTTGVSPVALREEALAHYRELLESMAKLGIKLLCYNFMVGPGWSRTGVRSVRGGALATYFNKSEYELKFRESRSGRDARGSGAGRCSTDGDVRCPRDGADLILTKEQVWSNYEYFIRSVMPTAEKCGVRMGLHPDDPCLPSLGGYARIFETVADYDRAYAIYPSESNAVTYCQANFKLMGADLVETAKHFGRRIAFIHVRDVEGDKTDFTELFHDQGTTDQFALMRTYRELGLDVPVRGDHVPEMEGDRKLVEDAVPGYFTLGRLFANGYLKALLKSCAFLVMLTLAGSADAFTLVSEDVRAKVVVSADEPDSVWRAAQDLTNDVRRIAGVSLPLKRGASTEAGDVFVLTVPDGRWEAYDVAESNGVLRIVGSDVRGTMFAVYDFIERYLGVDPMSFWNGVPYPSRRALAWEKVEVRQGPPSFRFRGWFLNDEDFINSWKPYAGERATGRGTTFIDKIMSHETLEHVLEALVRTRMNLIIPCSYFDPGNPADRRSLDLIAARGVFVTQHHHDPLGLSGFMFDNRYKRKGIDKTYSYFSSPKEMEAMWREAAEIYASRSNVIWQIGMRGGRDAPTWRSDPTIPKSDEARAATISAAMTKQIEILKGMGLSGENLHVTATLWGEGSYFNGKGLLNVPAGSVVVFSDNSPGWSWPEDFYKTVRRPDLKYGVYYHHQVWASGPHRATAVSVSRTHRMLREAYESKANEYVIFNVGNVREFCYGIDSSSKMTWNMPSFDPEGWQREWLDRGVGKDAEAWSSVMNLYHKSYAIHPGSKGPCFLDGQLATREFVMGWKRDTKRYEGVIPDIEAKLEKLAGGRRKVSIPHEEMTDVVRDDLLPDDPMNAALVQVMHPRMISWSDRRRRAASQQAGFAQALRYARALYRDTPSASRDFAFDQLVFPIAYMSFFTDAFVSLLDADEALDVGDVDGALGKIAESRDGFERILELGKRYCHGKWKGWWRNDGIHQRLNLMKLIGKIDDLAKMAKTPDGSNSKSRKKRSPSK